jgi:glycosyltransferase involved in cell wall biosynthesis
LGLHGLLAERGNVESLVEKLLVALELPEVGPSLRQRAVQHFSWRAAGEAIVAAYHELTQPGQPEKARTPVRGAGQV